MKKLISSLLLAFVCATAMAEIDAKEYGVFVKNDHHVFYCEHNGVTVVVDPTIDGIFIPHISIINESGHHFLFEPKKIKVQAYAIPGNTSKDTRYRVDRFLERGDTLGFEKDELTILSPEKYVKKMKNSARWAYIFSSAVSGAINCIGEDTPEKRYWSRVDSEKRYDAYEAAREAIDQVSEEYWRANTIFDKSEHEGYIAIKTIKTNYIVLDIPVDGENYHFVIDNKKHY